MMPLNEDLESVDQISRRRKLNIAGGIFVFFIIFIAILFVAPSQRTQRKQNLKRAPATLLSALSTVPSLTIRSTDARPSAGPPARELIVILPDTGSNRFNGVFDIQVLDPQAGVYGYVIKNLEAKIFVVDRKPRAKSSLFVQEAFFKTGSRERIKVLKDLTSTGYAPATATRVKQSRQVIAAASSKQKMEYEQMAIETERIAKKFPGILKAKLSTGIPYILYRPKGSKEWIVVESTYELVEVSALFGDTDVSLP